MQHRIVITAHRPWLKWLLIGGGSCALALSAWALYVYTRATTADAYAHAQSEVELMRQDRRSLVRELRLAREELRQLKAQATYIEQSKSIDEQATEVVRGQLAQLQAEASDLREQLAFYRGIVAPVQSQSGVRVHELKLSVGADPKLLTYRLVLVQPAQHDKRASGHVEIELIVAGASGEVHMPWAQLQSDGKASDLLFSMRYFEELSGEIRIPDGLVPQRVVVTVVPKGNAQARTETTYEWRRLLTHQEHP